jgi:hypothetical protein
MELALAALRGFRLWALAASIPGLVVIAGTFVAIAPGAGVWRTLLLFVLLLCGVLLTVVGALAGAAGGLLVRMPPALKATLFGTCPGSWIGKEPATPPATDDGKPLTPWLTDVIDRAAGRAETGAPLTFGELWGNDPHAQDVSLQTFTTCLTLGRPFRVPFAADEQFRFKPSEWRRLFPERVVDALAQGADWRAAPDTQLPLPPAAKLPVVVAARLSRTGRSTGSRTAGSAPTSRCTSSTRRSRGGRRSASTCRTRPIRTRRRSGCPTRTRRRIPRPSNRFTTSRPSARGSWRPRWTGTTT